MKKFFVLISLVTSVYAAEFTLISPEDREPYILKEDIELAIKLINDCKYIQKIYPKEYVNLHTNYIFVEMAGNRRLFDPDLCGLAVPEDKTIYIYPNAWTKHGCYNKRLTGTLVHEILHVMRLPDHTAQNLNVDNDAIEKAVYECWDKFTVEPTQVERDFSTF